MNTTPHEQSTTAQARRTRVALVGLLLSSLLLLPACRDRRHGGGIEFRNQDKYQIESTREQIIRVEVINGTEQAYLFKADVMGAPALVPGEVRGPGSMDEPLRLEPGATHELTVVVQGSHAARRPLGVVTLKGMVKAEDGSWEHCATGTFRLTPPPENGN